MFGDQRSRTAPRISFKVLQVPICSATREAGLPQGFVRGRCPCWSFDGRSSSLPRFRGHLDLSLGPSTYGDSHLTYVRFVESIHRRSLGGSTCMPGLWSRCKGSRIMADVSQGPGWRNVL